MSKKLFSLLLVVVLALVSVNLVAAQDDEDEEEFDIMSFFEDRSGPFTWDSLDRFADLGLEGTTVTIFGAFVDADAERFEQAIMPFEEVTGIDVVYEGSGDFETLINARVGGGDPPDIAAFPQPGLFADLADAIVPVTGGAAELMNTEFDPGWVEVSTVDGELKAVVYRANVKSLVWYNPAQFEAFGYEIPESWDGLLELSDLMVDDGYTPWCIGIESSGATGWVITDWVEDILLRTAPPETYDAWVANEIPFNDPAIVNALETAGEIVLDDEYVFGGAEAVLTTPFGDSPAGLFPAEGEDPDCFLHRQASFIPAFFPDGVEIAPDGDVWAFYLPPIDEEYGSPVLSAGDLFSAFSDRAEVMATLEYLAVPLSQEIWAAQGGFVAPNVNANLEVYPTELDRFYAELLVEADTVRFDASDLMPGAIGTGAFWSAMVEWVAGDATAEEALASVEEVWAGLGE
ncbi:MAG: ABC transporter substrate-binding protein [Chloroflexota bacterium]